MARNDLTDRFRRARLRSLALAVALLVLVSVYAAVLSLAAQDATPPAGTRSEALVMSVVLAAVSFAGIVGAARPSSCRGLLSPRKAKESPRSFPVQAEASASYPLVAHHCSCGRFADHTVRVGGRAYCAGCLGMAAGGVSGIGIAVALGTGLLFLNEAATLATVFIGGTLAAVSLALLYRRSSPGWHAAANFALVAGVVLLAALLSTHGLAAGMFGLLAALALVGLRIEMSRWRHLSIYAGCPWQRTCRGATAIETA